MAVIDKRFINLDYSNAYALTADNIPSDDDFSINQKLNILKSVSSYSNLPSASTIPDASQYLINDSGIIFTSDKTNNEYFESDSKIVNIGTGSTWIKVCELTLINASEIYNLELSILSQYLTYDLLLTMDLDSSANFNSASLKYATDYCGRSLSDLDAVLLRDSSGLNHIFTLWVYSTATSSTYMKFIRLSGTPRDHSKISWFSGVYSSNKPSGVTDSYDVEPLLPTTSWAKQMFTAATFS